jgi:hypothetical protein
METGRIERNPSVPRSGHDLEREAANRLEEIQQYFREQAVS